ncbi:cadmium resistance transporter [Natrialba swarupiae]|uniref:cadmium resistance transporter n=1 Tax=Natrialba swarupiae TaxID=2448032 RepID=UPI001390B5FC|nr:cadmium resistance transporter [Natrialba swarupiae]
MEVIIVVAFVLFAFTHFDTVIALIAFCADQEYGSSEVFLGHYLGFAIGLLLAVIGGLLFNELLHSWVHLLGIIPLTLGVLSILHRLPETNLIHRRASGYGGRIGVVAATGIGLSGENLAVFIPFFATLGLLEVIVIFILYAIGGGVLYLVASTVVRYTFSVVHLSWIDRWLVPIVLIVTGVFIMGSGVLG